MNLSTLRAIAVVSFVMWVEADKKASKRQAKGTRVIRGVHGSIGSPRWRSICAWKLWPEKRFEHPDRRRLDRPITWRQSANVY
jgi:hypothetical protein